MTELEIMKKLHEILPDSWHISEIVEESGLVKITCPIYHLQGKSFDETIEKIEKAIDADYDGGGAMIGDVKYDAYFYVRKPKKAKKTKKTTTKTNKKTTTKKGK